MLEGQLSDSGSDVCRRYASVSAAGNRCHFVLPDKDASCLTADLSNIGRPNCPVYSTGELLNTPLDTH